MESYTTSIEKLISKVEDYSKVSIELCKYNAIYKSANIISSIVLRVILVIAFVLFSIFLNIGVAIFIGDYLGKFYYGFFIVAGFYMVIAILFILFQDKWIKNPVCNFIIRKTLKDADL